MLQTGLYGDHGDDALDSRVAYDVGGRLSVQLAGGTGNDLQTIEDKLTIPVFRNQLNLRQPATIDYLLEAAEATTR